MPVNSFSKIQLFNAALTATRCNTITSNDGSKEWLLLESNYPTIVDAALERGKLYFGRERVDLTSRVPGKFGYDDGYVLPADVLMVRHVWIDDIITEDWTADDDTVYVNAISGVECEYIKKPVEQTFSRQFDLALIFKLQAVILRWKEQYSEADAMDQRGDFELLRARTVSSGQRGKTRPLREGRVMSRRRHGGS